MTRSQSVLSEPEIERGIEMLLDTCQEAADARGNREYLKEYLKSMKAILMSESDEKTQIAKEMEALSDNRYLDLLQEYREAVIKDEVTRARRSAIETQIEAWRTLEANRRAVR